MTEAETVSSGEQVNVNRRGFIFMGPEGSGKSSQAELLAKDLGFPYIKFSDLIRAHLNDEGELGEACRRVFAEHKYIEPEHAIFLLKERLSQEDVQGGFVVDGANRTLEEAEGLPQTLEALKMADIKLSIIALRVPGWMSMERMLKRGREDDTVEGSLSRLSEYYGKPELENQLGFRVSYMRKNWEMIHIDSRDSIDAVHEQLLNKLGITE